MIQPPAEHLRRLAVFVAVAASTLALGAAFMAVVALSSTGPTVIAVVIIWIVCFGFAWFVSRKAGE